MTFQPTRPQRFILPRKLQRRYRRHLFYFKLLLQIICARRSLDQLSRLCIHSVQEFHVRLIQSRKHTSETNIVVIYDQIPQHRFGTLLPFPPKEQTRDDDEEEKEKETNERERMYL